MTNASAQRADGYTSRRDWIEEYFDRTASHAWATLTSDAPVSGIRATVRAGRDRMRQTLAGWLPDDLHGRRILDAGCGTGQMSVALARRGADVVAVDLSKTLTDIARERLPADLAGGRVTFLAGDMLDPALGRFDHVVGMDSLIHYKQQDVLSVLCRLAARTNASIVFTFAPRTTLLSIMHAAGRLFPRGDRAPAIEPIGEDRLKVAIKGDSALSGWSPARTQRIVNGFYTSQALELVRQ